MTTAQRYTYRSADGTELVGYRWPAGQEKPVKGAIVLAHGMGEHMRRYDHVAEVLSDRGFVVYGHDHRGHGSSLAAGSTPGHLGPDGWRALVHDLNLVVALARSENPDLPVVIVAHSMGSFATQQFLLDHASDIDAVALTGTTTLDLLEPGLDLSADLDLAAFNAPFEPARTEYDWLSRDQQEVDAYVADPLCGFGIDLASAQAMFAGARRAADIGQVAAIPDGLPMYIAGGSEDPVNADLALLHALAERYRAAGLTDVTVATYDGARHEIFNETNRDEVIGDLLRWLDRVTGSHR